MSSSDSEDESQPFRQQLLQTVAMADGFKMLSEVTALAGAMNEEEEEGEDAARLDHQPLAKRAPYVHIQKRWTPDDWTRNRKFKRRMRMSLLCFQQLLKGFRTSPSFKAAGCESARKITAEAWLGLTIQDLASGFTLDPLCDMFGVHESAYSRRRIHLMHALVDACIACGQRRLGLPQTTDGWHELADTFSRPKYPEFDGEGIRTCLAGDGTLIGFSPYEKVPGRDKEKWRCRKGFLATNCVFYFDGYRRWCTLFDVHINHATFSFTRYLVGLWMPT